MKTHKSSCFFLLLIFCLTAPVSGQLIDIQDRNEFDLLCPGATIEDFEDVGVVVADEVFEFVVDSETMSGVIDPGEIADGIQFTTNLPEGPSGFGFVFFDVLTLTPTGAAFGPAVFAQGIVFDFPTPVDCLGFDLILLTLGNGSGGTYEFAFFDQNNNFIESRKIFVDFTAPVFVGVATSNGTLISRMEVVSEVNDMNRLPMGELVDNVAFRPVAAACDLGDINGDGLVDLLDVSPFVGVLTGQMFQCEADVNEDGVVDLLDVSDFVALLTGG